VFARHNLLDDFDSWSDISVWHKIRVPPTIFFYDGGAVVSNTTNHHIAFSGDSTTDIAIVLGVCRIPGLNPACTMGVAVMQQLAAVSASIAGLIATPRAGMSLETAAQLCVCVLFSYFLFFLHAAVAAA
jgi:hypothetical protein